MQLKATEDAKRNQVKIPLKDGRTLHHDVKVKMDQEKFLCEQHRQERVL